MKYKFIVIIFLISSCSAELSPVNFKKLYTAKGFAYIYNESDFNAKIIKGKMNNELMQISNQNVKTGALIKIINPQNKESLVLKNTKRIKYPDFYKILITNPVAEKLKLDTNLPILEIIEIKKNKSFIAKRQKFLMRKKISLQKLQ